MMTKKQISALAFNLKKAIVDTKEVKVTAVQHLIAQSLGFKSFQAVPDTTKTVYPVKVSARTELDVEFLTKLKEISALEIEGIYFTALWNDVDACLECVAKDDINEDTDQDVLGIQCLEHMNADTLYLSEIFPIKEKIIYEDGDVVWITQKGEIQLYKNVSI